MEVLVLGAGKMAYGIIFDLLKNNAITKITIIDNNDSALNEMRTHFDFPHLEYHFISADNINKLKPLFEKARGAISALPYDFNLDLTKLAIDTNTHFVDLGGNNRIVEKQFLLDEKARSMNVGIVPDCGLAPGMASVISAYLIDMLARVDNVKIRVGGLPLLPQTPLKYKIVFSVHGLINEYVEPTLILEDGKIKTVTSMTGLENIDFESPFGLLEAFYTSGGLSTLPYTFKENVINMDYKTIRYPGHCYLMKSMIDLGFTDKKDFVKINDSLVSRRELFETMLNSSLQYNSDDVVLIRVTVDGQKEGKEKTIAFQAIEYPDKKNKLTAMMRTTAFPAAIILQMLLSNKITERGVLKQETSVPGFDFISELEKRGIYFEKSED